MSAYVLSFLDSMRQRTWFLGHWRTLTDIGGLGRTLADIDGHWRTWTDISGLGRTMADLDGQWRTWTDIGRLGRTLADSDGLVLQRADLSSEIAKQRGILEGFGSWTGLSRIWISNPASRILPDRNRWFQSDKKGSRILLDFAGKFPSFPRLIFIEHFLQLA